MRIFLFIGLACVVLCSCSKPKKGVEIEMLTMQGAWERVITVHGYYDNEIAAQDIIRALHAVSRTDGTVVREYRIRP